MGGTAPCSERLRADDAAAGETRHNKKALFYSREREKQGFLQPDFSGFGAGR